MAKKKYYWKALSIQGNKFTSRIMLGKYRLMYPVGEWVKPSVGKIFIFKTQREAVSFGGNDQRIHCVKKCEAKGITKPRGDRLPFDTKSSFPSFWHKIFKNSSLPISDDWPNGTLWAKTIKIVE